MAEKDFAKTDSSGFIHEDNHREANSRLTVILILALIFAMISFAIGFFMGEKHGLESDKGNKHAALVAKLQTQQQELEKLKQVAKKHRRQEVRTSQVGELTFYNELPKQSIVPEPLDGSEIKMPSISSQEDAAISDKKDDIQAAEEKLNAIIAREMNTSAQKFRIQIASFKQRKDAEALASQLGHMNIDTTIQRVNLAELGDRYRVHSTTFDKQDDAMQTKQRVHEKFGITAIIISE